MWECVGERFDEGAGISVDVAGGLHDEGYEDVANCLDGGCVFGNFGIGSRLCSVASAVIVLWVGDAKIYRDVRGEGVEDIGTSANAFFIPVLVYPGFESTRNAVRGRCPNQSVPDNVVMSALKRGTSLFRELAFAA